MSDGAGDVFEGTPRNWSPLQTPPHRWSPESELPEILPDVILGWLLLARSGFDASERANILSSCQNQLGTKAVEKAMRTQWPDRDLQERDQRRGNMKPQTGFYGIDEQSWESPWDNYWIGDEEWESCAGEETWEEPEGDFEMASQEELVAAEAAEAEALAVIEGASRTLAEARQQIAGVRLRRGYWPHGKGPAVRGHYGAKGFRKGKSKGKPTKSGKGSCYKCGSPGHWTAQCPDKSDPKLPTVTHSANACLTMFECAPASTAWGVGESQSFLAEEDIRAGKAILDCGATKSIGGMSAMEHLGYQCDSGKVKVDIRDRPWFTFGNGQRKQVSSKVTFPIMTGKKAGTVSIYALDVPNVPLLLSVDALVKMGAWIDFESGTAVFRKLDPTLVVHLERSANGHLLLNLAKDLLTQGVPMSKAKAPWNQMTTGKAE